MMKRALTSLAWLVGAAGSLLAIVHILIRPVNPAQQVPEPHPPGPCWVCHVVSDAARIVDD